MRFSLTIFTTIALALSTAAYPVPLSKEMHDCMMKGIKRIYAKPKNTLEEYDAQLRDVAYKTCKEFGVK